MSNIIQPNYMQWGLAGTTSLIKEPVSEKTIRLAIKSFENLFDIKNVFLKKTSYVHYYQGQNIKEKKLALLRFEKNNNEPIILNGEQLSFLFDEQNNVIVGYMNMLVNLSNKKYIDHQSALTIAIGFLQKINLVEIAPNQVLPNVNEKNNTGNKINFNHCRIYHDLELRWIGKHGETVSVDNKMIEIKSMKVKFYHPLTNLWTWVIIDEQGKVIALEYSVYWNFEQGKRETQLWLHDKWLMAHSVF